MSDSVCLTTFGTVEPALEDAVEREIRSAFALPVRRVPPLPVPASAWDPKRRQHSAPAILAALLADRPPEALRALALTELDLYIPMLSFVYGQAQLGGTAAVVSLARLRQDFYGLAADAALLAVRAGKEAVHELGHTFGLIHCPDVACVMTLATNIRQLDLKLGGFCAGCSALLRDALRRQTPQQLKGHG